MAAIASASIGPAVRTVTLDMPRVSARLIDS
jgi:hypothetical protein